MTRMFLRWWFKDGDLPMGRIHKKITLNPSSMNAVVIFFALFLQNWLQHQDAECFILNKNMGFLPRKGRENPQNMFSP